MEVLTQERIAALQEEAKIAIEDLNTYFHLPEEREDAKLIGDIIIAAAKFALQDILGENEAGFVRNGVIIILDGGEPVFYQLEIAPCTLNFFNEEKNEEELLLFKTVEEVTEFLTEKFKNCGVW